MIFLSLRLVLVSWWHRTWLRRSFFALLTLNYLTIFLWGIGEYFTISPLAGVGRTVGVMLGVLSLALLVSLPLSALLVGIDRSYAWFSKGRFRTRNFEPVSSEDLPQAVNPSGPQADIVPDPARRQLLGRVAAGIPIATLSLAGVGMADTFQDIPVREEKLIVPGLPPALEGLRLWHLSDAHLYHYVRLKNIEALAETIAPLRPDLIAVTGDVADDLSQLAPALEILHSIPTTLGIYATLGNHEYFRGIKRVLKIYDASPVPLLVNDSVNLTFGGVRFRLAGIDDPQTLRRIDGEFYERTIGLAVPDDSLPTILMSHRPNAFPVSTRRKIMLTLAGHTHGGQIGIGGRSVFEAPGRYLWGYYQESQSALYTSSGAGHWFPFRLGCPQEAPLFVLTSGGSASAQVRESRQNSVFAS